MALQDDYRAIREGAALVPTDDRARIGVSGRDRASYLQGLLTNDIQALTPGTGCYAAWLTAQGRMTTDMHVLESGDMILLDVPAASRESVLQRLDEFIFSEDVQLADLTTTLALIAVHGPLAASAIERATGTSSRLASWSNYHNERIELAGSSLVVARIDQFGVPGFAIYAESERESGLVAALERAGAVRVGDDAVAVARIEAGYPAFGSDLNEDIIPLEAGIEQRALSFTKGCYVGQEVIIRVRDRGHGRVARRLVGLRINDAVVPRKGDRLFASGRDVGFVTSSASSPRLGAIALGYVHRDFVAPGTGVEIETGGGRAAAAVSALPLE